MKTKEQIIKETIKSFLQNAIILLFGSRSRSDFEFDSDYDLLVIVGEDITVEMKRDYKAKIRRALAKQKIPIDILIYSKTEVDIKKKINGHIVKQALKEGLVL